MTVTRDDGNKKGQNNHSLANGGAQKYVSSCALKAQIGTNFHEGYLSPTGTSNRYAQRHC